MGDACQYFDLPWAYFTRVRPLSSVNSHVNCQLRPLVKFCSTLATVERFLLCICSMCSHVVFDMSFERLVANITFVHFLSLMEGEDVPFQSVCSRICLKLLEKLEHLLFVIKLQYLIWPNAGGPKLVKPEYIAKENNKISLFWLNLKWHSKLTFRSNLDKKLLPCHKGGTGTLCCFHEVLHEF